ncbi:TetR/AcrR family transcriptional regulator [Peribacillus simplex]|uniref:TetR/AcrR family transcriptional regulator n=1 Tax=Peribacillus TaxID=2675229 RepID=UPI0021621E29|nr:MULTISPECIES: TetR/AcrR family transcriptional regulator [Peribacillus]MBX9956156.1 TetR/AcrR family transcriptional regulator [Peribacillus simplex]
MENGKTGDKRHLRSIMTRQKLLEAAKEIFLEEGYQAALISQMIKRAKIGYGTAYVHFKGKEDLLIVLMENVMEQFYEIAETSFFPKSKDEAKHIINSQANAFLKMAEAERNMMQVFEQAIGISTIISDKWKAIRMKFIQRISQDVAYAQQNGLARTELNHELVARGWFFTNEMYLWEIVRNEHQSSVEEIAQTITSVYVEGLYV